MGKVAESCQAARSDSAAKPRRSVKRAVAGRKDVFEFFRRFCSLLATPGHIRISTPMEQLKKRLRDRGASYGHKWAADDENSDALERLIIACPTEPSALERFVPADHGAAGESYGRVGALIAGHTLRSASEVKAVWEHALGGEVEPSLSEPWFLRGFLEGALGVRFA